MNSALSTQPCANSQKGWITTFYVRYGTKKLGPYYARSWKQNGKLHRQYIKAEDLEKVKAACQKNREQREHRTRVTKTYTKVAANLNFLYRMLKRSKARKPRRDETNHLTLLYSQGLESPRPPLRRAKRSFGPSIQRPIQRSIVLPGDVSRSQTRRQPKSTTQLQTKRSFMYPRVTKHSPTPSAFILHPSSFILPPSSFRPMNSFFKPSPQQASEIPNIQFQAPGSNLIQEKLAALNLPQTPSTPKKLGDLKPRFPEAPKVERRYFERLLKPGEVQKPISEIEWLPPTRFLSETRPNTIVEIYRSANGDWPEVDEEDAYSDPSSDF